MAKKLAIGERRTYNTSIRRVCKKCGKKLIKILIENQW